MMRAKRAGVSPLTWRSPGRIVIVTDSAPLPLEPPAVIGGTLEEAWVRGGSAAVQGHGLVLLRDTDGEPTSERLRTLADRLGPARRSVLDLDSEGDNAGDLHVVAPSEHGQHDSRGVLILSSTFEPIRFHTDAYNAERPPRLVLLQIESSGESVVSYFLHVRLLVARLAPAICIALGESVYPTVIGRTAILSDVDEGDPRIRLNLHEIENHLELKSNIDLLDRTHLGALQRLARSLHTDGAQFAVRLRVGDVVVLDNRRVLHARSQLSRAEESGRRVHRLWVD